MNTEYLFSRRNLDFLLFETHDISSLFSHPYYNAHDKETIGLILGTATNIAEKQMRPFLAETDRHPPFIRDGQVIVHPSTHSFYRAFAETGLLSSTFENSYGGLQLPKTVFAAVDFIIGSAHNGFEMYTGLSIAAARLLISFGTADQIQQFAQPIINGQWTATMCLTESQAGSALGDISTLAAEQADGSYRIKGQKIFISAGDHDLTENIVHLVLARKTKAPEGIKGLSLFIVPKKRKDESDSLVSNDVSSVAIYHKMGQQGTPAMHLEFGAQNDCTGYLIGEENQGMKYMFQMMNSSRLGVGMAGTYIASAAYYTSLQYAKQRVQGRRWNEKNANTEPVAIIQHPDVRRLLLRQKAFVEGSLSLILQCHLYQDILKVSAFPEEKNRYQQLLELLTPVVKAYGSEEGHSSVQAGLQVLGGYGYTKDFILEQLARDVRIMSIYEGTNAIQAQALLGRQILGNDGSALALWHSELNKDLDQAMVHEVLVPYITTCRAATREFISISHALLSAAKTTSPEETIANATIYLEWFGILNMAWQWIKQASVVRIALGQSPPGEESIFYQSKLETMKYFFQYEWPKSTALKTTFLETDLVTLFNENEIII